MTSILIDLRIDAPTGPVGTAGSLVATPSRIRIDGAVVTLPRAMTFLVAESGVTSIELPAPDATWYYKLGLYVGVSLQDHRLVTLPASGAVAWADLVDVDPETYAPLDPDAPGVVELLDAVAVLSTTAQQAVTTANGASAAAAAAAAAVPRNPLVVGDNLTFQLADGTQLDAGNVRGPAGAGVPYGVLLTSEDLNSLTVAGTYRQPTGASATLARNYPYAGNSGVLEVFDFNGTSGVLQRFTTLGGASGDMRGIYQRRKTGTSTWGAWQYIARQRVVDGAGGRAIYTWDDLNGRDQLIYGDTGVRDVTSLILVAGIITSIGAARLSRTNQTVELDIVGLTKAAGSVTFSGFFPAGFLPVSTAAAVGNDSGGNFPSLAVSTTGDLIVRSSTPVNNGGVTLQFRTNAAWPATLPGTAVGTVPFA